MIPQHRDDGTGVAALQRIERGFELRQVVDEIPGDGEQVDAFAVDHRDRLREASHGAEATNVHVSQVGDAQAVQGGRQTDDAHFLVTQHGLPRRPERYTDTTHQRQPRMDGW